WAWDLGNENSNCCVPPTSEHGARWLERIAEAIRSADASCAITLGLHLEDLEDDRRIGPGEAARVCDVLCMHGYPLYAPWCAGPGAAPPPAPWSESDRIDFHQAPRETLIRLYRDHAATAPLARPVL